MKNLLMMIIIKRMAMITMFVSRIMVGSSRMMEMMNCFSVGGGPRSIPQDRGSFTLRLLL